MIARDDQGDRNSHKYSDFPFKALTVLRNSRASTGMFACSALAMSIKLSSAPESTRTLMGNDSRDTGERLQGCFD